ncbi:hypothetical protein H0H92_012790 [Tricholoma furcatifolium]|nr:hypothetical protein H0H92_012790 [Tricholoma furcatifolium]
MSITFELKAPSIEHPTRRVKKQHKTTKIADKIVEIELYQDKTALRSRKGDTGSVLWKASIDFAQLILQQLHSQAQGSLFDLLSLKCAHVLELGAGTGLLAVALAPYVGHYTVTDIADLQALLRKNVAANFTGWPDHCVAPTPGSNISVKELDWVVLNNTPFAHRKKLMVDIDSDPVDLILVVDCIYHPSLLPALVETIHHITVPGRTAVLVVVELRAEDVIREFLSLWLARPGWEIWRVNEGLGRPYAMWLGWRNAEFDT